MDKYKIVYLKTTEQFMLICPTGHLYFEWSFSDAVIRMDLHADKFNRTEDNDN